jgi:PEP-CTERM motif
VTKDIALATVNGGFVTISEIRQSFTQVPEAATTALVCIGLALIGATAHRKARNS